MTSREAQALARLYDLDLGEPPDDVQLYLALAARTGDPIVEVGVGTGRVAISLATAGHRVVGIDLDRAMLERAERAAAGAGGQVAERLELVEGDALQPRATERGRFRLAILALNTLLLFAERARQERAVAALAELAAPGGLVVVDTWQPQPEDLVRFDGRMSLEWLRTDPETGATVTKIAAAWYEPATRTVVLTTIFEEGRPGEAPVRWTRTDRMRLAAADELVEWAERAGLEIEQLGGDHDLSPFASGSERVVLVARRP